MAYDYARRNQLAKAKGFRSASEYRTVTTFANRSKDFRDKVGSVGGSSPDIARLANARLYYQAFGPKADPNDYSIQLRKGKPVVRGGKGAKAKWLIDIAGYVGDAAEWKFRYPGGVRE